MERLDLDRRNTPASTYSREFVDATRTTHDVLVLTSGFVYRDAVLSAVGYSDASRKARADLVTESQPVAVGYNGSTWTLEPPPLSPRRAMAGESSSVSCFGEGRCRPLLPTATKFFQRASTVRIA